MTFHVSWLENQYPAQGEVVNRIKEIHHTFLDGNRSDIAHMIFLFHQLRCFGLPNLFDILVRETAKELDEESKQLAFVRVIEIAIILTLVGLSRINGCPGLISNIGDRTHMAVALVKYLESI